MGAYESAGGNLAASDFLPHSGAYQLVCRGRFVGPGLLIFAPFAAPSTLRCGWDWRSPLASEVSWQGFGRGCHFSMGETIADCLSVAVSDQEISSRFTLFLLNSIPNSLTC